MTGVRLYAGTRKGLFVLEADGDREEWAVREPAMPGCADALLDRCPTLEPHLLDDGRLRDHLVLLHNGAVVADDAAAVSLAAGDQIVVLQAVSGGEPPEP